MLTYASDGPEPVIRITWVILDGSVEVGIPLFHRAERKFRRRSGSADAVRALAEVAHQLVNIEAMPPEHRRYGSENPRRNLPRATLISGERGRCHLELAGHAAERNGHERNRALKKPLAASRLPVKFYYHCIDQSLHIVSNYLHKSVLLSPRVSRDRLQRSRYFQGGGNKQVQPGLG